VASVLVSLLNGCFRKASSLVLSAVLILLRVRTSALLAATSLLVPLA
jgi:hypothetical protein